MNFDYGNVLTRAFQITWKHKSFWLFMMLPMLIASAMFVAFAVPVFLVGGSYEAIGIVSLLWIGIFILGSIINLVVNTAGISSLTLGILRAERGEGSTAFMDLVRDGFQHFGRIFSAVLIIQLTIGAIFTVVFLCMTLLSLVTMGLASFCLQPIMLLLTPLSFLTIAVTDGAVIAVIDENLSAWEAVKRAIQVVREHVWKFIILTLIVYLGTTILSSIYCPRYDSRNGGSDHARVRRRPRWKYCTNPFYQFRLHFPAAFDPFFRHCRSLHSNPAQPELPTPLTPFRDSNRPCDLITQLCVH